MTRTIPRRAWTIGGVLALVAVTWWTVGRQQPIDVDVSLASTGPLRVVVDEDGTTRVRGHADVSAPVGGRWVPSRLRAGDAVDAGTLLGVLHPSPLDATAQQQARARLGAAEAAVRESETRVVAARTALDEAKRTLARVERLEAAGGMAPQELERARDAVTARDGDHEVARLRVTATRFERDAARSVVISIGGERNALRVVAPTAGRVLRVFEEHERVLPPGAPLVEVGDPRDLEVVIPLRTSDAARVQVGAPVSLTFRTGGDTIHGRVSRIEPAAFTKVSALGVEEQRVNVIVTAPSTDVHVGDHYRVYARVTVWSSENVLRVPTGALVRDGVQFIVYVIEQGRAVPRPVTIGERGAELVEVRSGLTDGARVIVYPDDLVRPGVRVNEP